MCWHNLILVSCKLETGFQVFSHIPVLRCKCFPSVFCSIVHLYPPFWKPMHEMVYNYTLICHLNNKVTLKKHTSKSPLVDFFTASHISVGSSVICLNLLNLSKVLRLIPECTVKDHSSTVMFWFTFHFLLWTFLGLGY